MVKCKRCGHNFESNNKLIKHLNNKFPCDEILSTINRDFYIEEIKNSKKTILKDGIKYYKCKFCNKDFKSSPSKSVHQKKCELKHTEKNTLFNTNEIQQNTTNINNNNTNNGTIINNPTINNNGLVNNGVIINVSSNVDQNTLNEINNLITQHKLNRKIKSFPNYSIGHLFDNDFYLLKLYIDKCKKEDSNPNTGYRSKFNLALELFKEIFKAEDYRTKNTFIKEITDNIAYCYLDDKFYSISLEDLFKIFFEHLHVLLKNIIKIKDNYNGMKYDDKEYVDFSYAQFRDFIDNTTDKSEFKKEIINCMYQNKIVLQDLLNSATPIDKFKKDKNPRTLRFKSNLVDKIRKKYDLNPEKENEMIIELGVKDIEHRVSNTVDIIDSDDNKIKIDFNNTESIDSPNGYKLYKTIYKKFIIWYDPDKEIGYIDFMETRQVISKEKIITLIDCLVGINFENKDIYDIVGPDNMTIINNTQTIVNTDN